MLPTMSSQQGAQTDVNGRERHVLRQKYRKVEEDARNNSEVLASIASGALKRTLHDVNELQKQVTKPREGALDAGLFCELTKAGMKATEKLVNNHNGRTVHDFVVALRSVYVGTSNPQEDGCEDSGAFDWHQLSKVAAQLFKPTPGASCMLGPMDVQSKVRRVVQRQAKRPSGEVVRPDELDRIQEQEKQETDRNMEEMWGILQREPACPVADLICNHDCFAQTVENLFTLSFLVRDQKAYLYHDAEQGMMVQSVDVRNNKRAPQQDGKKDEEQLQFMLAITMADWELMKKVVKSEDTKMRHRDQVALMALNKAGLKRKEQQEEQVTGENIAGPSGSKPRISKR